MSNVIQSIRFIGSQCARQPDKQCASRWSTCNTRRHVHEKAVRHDGVLEDDRVSSDASRICHRRARASLLERHMQWYGIQRYGISTHGELVPCERRLCREELSRLLTG